MLHINDIKERLERNPEPQFVVDVRNNILESFSRLEFVEEGHKYYFHQDDGSVITLPSVSHICHQFEPKADWDAIAQKNAIKRGLTKEEVQREWREKNIRSTSNGTLTHEFGEAYMHFFQGRPELMPEAVKKRQYEDGFLIPYGKKEEAVCRFYEDLYKIDNFYPVMPESKIYTGIEGGINLNQNYSGTFDMLFACLVKGQWKLVILDYKTNGSLTNDFNRNMSNMMLEPFNLFIDEAKSHYTVQLSLYQLGIEQLKYEVIDRKIIWLKEDGTYEKISVPDVTKELLTVL